MSRPTAGRRALAVSLAIAAAIVALDQGTKQWALSTLDDRIIDVVWTLRFNLAFNSGMAFGRGQGWGPVIGVVATIVVVGLLVSLRNENSRLSTVAIGLIVGGALGNILDRLFRGDGLLHGSVVDFIDFQWFPIFNVADIAINVGGGLMILGFVLGSRRSSDPQESSESNASSESNDGVGA
ncbi:MAG: signal peptidase II [Acidimicrobiales bacterium mtb01]|nr:signal peptidase II [Actinomycetota bacterium]TEX45934.1 MAG: signal peptidase II [Acidimicrobiales bacterium mtb01]